MWFEFYERTHTGQIQLGMIEAVSEDHAIELLAKQNKMILRIDVLEEAQAQTVKRIQNLRRLNAIMSSATNNYEVEIVRNTAAVPATKYVFNSKIRPVLVTAALIAAIYIINLYL